MGTAAANPVSFLSGSPVRGGRPRGLGYRCLEGWEATQWRTESGTRSARFHRPVEMRGRRVNRRASGRIVPILVALSLLAGCASTPTELVFNMRPEGCHYDGPTELTEGEYRFLLYLDGLGEAELELRRVESDGSQSTIETIERRWPEQDVTSASTALVQLNQGDYEIACRNVLESEETTVELAVSG